MVRVVAVARCRSRLWAAGPLLLLLRWPGLLFAAEQVALVEVFLEQRPDASALLQGEVVESGSEKRDELRGELVLVRLVCEGGWGPPWTNLQPLLDYYQTHVLMICWL